MIISLNKYQEEARSTAIYPKEHGLPYTITGLAAEAGEVAGKYAKVLRDNHGVLYEKQRMTIIDEIGDVLWFVAMVAYELGFTLEAVARINLSKLADRQARHTLQGSGDNR